MGVGGDGMGWVGGDGREGPGLGSNTASASYTGPHVDVMLHRKR